LKWSSSGKEQEDYDEDYDYDEEGGSKGMEEWLRVVVQRFQVSGFRKEASRSSLRPLRHPYFPSDGPEISGVVPET